MLNLFRYFVGSGLLRTVSGAVFGAVSGVICRDSLLESVPTLSFV